MAAMPPMRLRDEVFMDGCSFDGSETFNFFGEVERLLVSL